MEAKVYDAIVVGGGPGGYTAAIRLAQLGKRTLVVEREKVGGVCLNWGCVPSKALITAAGLVDRVRHAEVMGIRAEPVVDFGRMHAWKDGIVEKLTSNVASLIRSNGGDLVQGSARLAGPRMVEVALDGGGTARYEARDAVVLATGARLGTLPGLEPDGERIVDARQLVEDVREIPESLLVVGGGVIGLELGMMLQRLGTRLTVVEVTDGLLPGTDPDLARVVEKKLKARSGEVLTGARALGWEARGGQAAVTVGQGDERREIVADRVLVAVGFQPLSAGLGLEALGVRLDARGHLAVDDRMRTSVPWMYAVGDVTGGPYLAHKAFREAELAAEVIAGKNVRRDWLALPAAIFTDPEIATVGLTEAEAKRQGRPVRVGRFPFAASGRGLSMSETDGFVKVVADDDRVLGVGIVGAEASELIAEAAFGLEMMASAEDFALTIHTHPTMSEGVMEAFKHALGEAVHILNRGSGRPVRAPVAVAA